MCAGSNIHLLLKGGESHEPTATPAVTEGSEESNGATPEIIPLAMRTKEGMADLVKVLKSLPGEQKTSFLPPSLVLQHALDCTRKCCSLRAVGEHIECVVAFLARISRTEPKKVKARQLMRF